MTPTRVSSEDTIVDVETLRSFVERILTAAGCEASTVAQIASTFVEADLRGVGTQGLDHVPTMLKLLINGTIIPTATPRIVSESEAVAVIDGERAPGQLAAAFGTEIACAKAAKSGIAAVGIRNSAVLFMMGYYAELVARRGFVGILFTDTPPLVHAHGGIHPVLGTNPIAIGIPRRQRDPILIDMATSSISFSRLRQSSYTETPLPQGSAIDEDGVPTISPSAALRGALSPLGGHKGFALGLAVAILSGPLVGASVGSQLAGWTGPGEAGSKGHLFLAIDPGAFGPRGQFESSIEQYLEEIRNSGTGDSPLRIPGERQFAERARRLGDGIPISPHVWNRLAPYARKLGVDLPPVQ
jgi:LDH2 family malate/lactate/ureidoglycolate dehydrogenase